MIHGQYLNIEKLTDILTGQGIQRQAKAVVFRRRLHEISGVGCTARTGRLQGSVESGFSGTVAKLAMRQPFVLFKGLTFQKLCLP
ncbi:hypothetical protein, partial [Escherichia coli]